MWAGGWGGRPARHDVRLGRAHGALGWARGGGDWASGATIGLIGSGFQHITRPHQILPDPNTSVADSVFMNKIKCRIVHCQKGYADPSKIMMVILLSSDKCLQLTTLVFHFDGS